MAPTISPNAFSSVESPCDRQSKAAEVSVGLWSGKPAIWNPQRLRTGRPSAAVCEWFASQLHSWANWFGGACEPVWELQHLQHSLWAYNVMLGGRVRQEALDIALNELTVRPMWR